METLATFLRKLLHLGRAQVRQARRNTGSDPGLNFLVLDRGGDRYIFCWDDSQHENLMRVAGRFACDERLNFTWRDAWRVADCVAQMKG